MNDNSLMIVEKYLRSIHRVYSYIHGKLAFLLYSFVTIPPSKLHFLITTKCNLKCHFCYCLENLNQKEDDILQPADWNKISSTIRKNTAVIFTGGEAFLYQHIYEALEILFKKRRLVSITTNGVKIDIDKLFKTHPKSMFVMMFSIHGPEAVHDKITGMQGSYRKAIDNIHAIHDYKKKHNLKYPIMSLKAVLCEDNAHLMKDFIEQDVVQLPIQHLYFNLLSYDTLHHSLELYEKVDYEKLDQKPVYEYPDKTKKIIIDLIDYIDQKSFSIDVGFTDEFKNNQEIIKFIENPHQFSVGKCNRPWHEMLIYRNGDFGNCLGYVAGNIKKYNYNVNKIFKTPEYKSFLTMFKGKGRALNACYGCKEAVFHRD